MPGWLRVLAIASLAAGALSAVLIVVDVVAGHRQRMWIMNVVWPLTALWAGPLGLWAYWRMGRRLSTHGERRPRWQTIAVAASHCGGGCTLGDLVAEWLVFAVPVSLFGMTLLGGWAVDYAFAFLFGIAFQYFTIVPMRRLSPARGVVAAVKADALSLTAWQVGMYGWMAIVVFAIFGRELSKTSPVFWFMMQVAMLAGFLTSYPVNAWLLHARMKEPM